MKLESSTELGKLANLTDYLPTLNRINFRLFNWEFPNFKLSKFSIFQLSFQTPCKPKYDFKISLTYEFLHVISGKSKIDSENTNTLRKKKLACFMNPRIRLIRWKRFMV